jgi:hypothetical protein
LSVAFFLCSSDLCGFHTRAYYYLGSQQLELSRLLLITLSAIYQLNPASGVNVAICASLQI